MKVFFILITASLLLTGCVTPAHQPAADMAYADEVKAGKVKGKKARVFVYLGSRNSVIGNLPPGSYEFSMKERAASNMALKSDVTSYRLYSGQSLYLAFDWNQHAGSAFGLLGAISDPDTGELANHNHDDKQTVAGLKIVLPDNDTVSQLHPMEK